MILFFEKWLNDLVEALATMVFLRHIKRFSNILISKLGLSGYLIFLYKFLENHLKAGVHECLLFGIICVGFNAA